MPSPGRLQFPCMLLCFGAIFMFLKSLSPSCQDGRVAHVETPVA